MTHQKDLEVAQYLAQHRKEWGAERLSWPPIWRFDVHKLPHNEILNVEFWTTVGNHSTVTIHEQPDGSWNTSL